jgi:hypothetical protein
MNLPPPLWVLLRLLILVLNTWSLQYYNFYSQDFGWLACVSISVTTGFFLFGWLTVTEKKGSLDWTKFFSVSKPFWPMTNYPIPFWLLCAEILIVLGIISLASELLEQRAPAAGSTALLSVGIAILAALSLRKYLSNRTLR